MHAGTRTGLGHDVVAGALVVGEATPGTEAAYLDPLGPVLAQTARGNGPALAVCLALVIGQRKCRFSRDDPRHFVVAGAGHGVARVILGHSSISTLAGDHSPGMVGCAALA